MGRVASSLLSCCDAEGKETWKAQFPVQLRASALGSYMLSFLHGIPRHSETMKMNLLWNLPSGSHGPAGRQRATQSSPTAPPLSHPASGPRRLRAFTGRQRSPLKHSPRHGLAREAVGTEAQRREHRQAGTMVGSAEGRSTC